jgi:hypothetical protein
MYMSPAERSLAGAWREWTENPEAVRPAPSSRVGRGSTLGQSVLEPTTPTSTTFVAEG